MADPTSTIPVRRVIHLVGSGLPLSVQTAAPVATRIHTNTADGIEISTLVAGTSDDYYRNTVTELGASIRRGEMPVLYIESHGENNPADGGRHHLTLQEAPPPASVTGTAPKAPSVNTASLLERFVDDYQRLYREQYGADAAVPKLTIMVSSCYSEGLLRDIPPALLNSIDLVVDDSQERTTWQRDGGNLLAAVADSPNAEEMYFRQLMYRPAPPAPAPSSGFAPPAEPDDGYSLPAIATAQGVMDADALGSRVTAQNFNEAKARALANVSRLSPSLQASAASAIAGISAENFVQTGNERARALLGTMANYDTRFTPLLDYQRMAPALRDIYNAASPVESVIGQLRRVDANTQAMVLGLEDTPVPPGFLDNPGQPASGATLIAALKNDDESGVRIQLRIGANPNARDAEGRTPLSVAAERGNIDMIRALLDAGAQVNAVDTDGLTALSYASDFLTVDMVNLLVERGADVNLAGPGSASPLVQATAGNNTVMIARLSALGARTEPGMDANGDGIFSSNEANRWMIARDPSMQGFLPATINPIFDLNNDGQATLQEVAKLLSDNNVVYREINSAADMQSRMDLVVTLTSPATPPVPAVPTTTPSTSR